MVLKLSKKPTLEKYVALFGMRENNVGYARGFRAWLSAQF